MINGETHEPVDVGKSLAKAHRSMTTGANGNEDQALHDRFVSTFTPAEKRRLDQMLQLLDHDDEINAQFEEAIDLGNAGSRIPSQRRRA